MSKRSNMLDLNILNPAMEKKNYNLLVDFNTYITYIMYPFVINWCPFIYGQSKKQLRGTVENSPAFFSWEHRIHGWEWRGSFSFGSTAKHTAFLGALKHSESVHRYPMTWHTLILPHIVNRATLLKEPRSNLSDLGRSIGLTVAIAVTVTITINNYQYNC